MEDPAAHDSHGSDGPRRALNLPRSAYDSVRTLALHFYILSREGISMEKAYATAAVLVLSILGINLLAYWIMRRFIARVT